MKIAVVGCGPAGLAAVHAAVGLGCSVKVMAPLSKTVQRGPLLIQRPIPGINTGHPDGTIHQRVIGGSILDYRYRLYGDINIGINGDILRSEYHAWNHRVTYDKLWDRYCGLIQDVWLSPLDLSAMQDDPEFDLVVSTANSRDLCTNQEHNFLSVPVAVTREASYPDQPDDTIIFNASDRYAWVRSSRIFGHEVTEWRVSDAPAHSVIISKPISTDCNCYPHVLRTGRFGAWRNETWVDTAYWDTYGAITSMQRREELDAIK